MSAHTVAVASPRGIRLEDAASYALVAFAGALQISIAAAQILLAAAVAGWLALLVSRRERFEAPAMFWPLMAYAVLTLVAAAFSVDPVRSFADCRQLLLFLIVPAVYRLARGGRANLILLVIISVGAASAAYGIYQYGILKYDYLGKRPQGAMSHYMTYSGLLMLVVIAAVGRLLFRAADRAWPALVLPALVVALSATFTRSAWVGASAGVALLFLLKDFRLVAILPVAAALFFALAPPNVADRMYSVFDLNDPTTRDRVAMVRAGVRIVWDHPVTGVGPDAVLTEYPRYRDPDAVQKTNPHLHNVPLQIAAERGLPALGAWLWFVGLLVLELARRFRSGAAPEPTAIALASVACMLAAGMFEYNFGDSEFLMLFLVLVTLPFAAVRDGLAGQPLDR
jgi:O-antigen ligase